MSIAGDPAEADLTRRRQLRARAHGRILARAQALAPADRALVEQVYAQGQSLRQIAQASGVPSDRLQRRLLRLLKRMRTPLFTFVASRGELLPREVQATAERVVLQGQSLRETARQTRQSLYRVRQHMQIIRTYQRVAGDGGPIVKRGGVQCALNFR
jgi:DNA-directed RNA polymerase specialized sigma24 family protein